MNAYLVDAAKCGQRWVCKAAFPNTAEDERRGSSWCPLAEIWVVSEAVELRSLRFGRQVVLTCSRGLSPQSKSCGLHW